MTASGNHGSQPSTIQGYSVPAWIVAALHNERGVELAIESIKADFKAARFPIHADTVLPCLEEVATARMERDMDLYFECKALQVLSK